MDLGISGLISGGISALTGAYTAKQNLKAVRETNAAQMELAKYQADRNLDLWNLNNEYNTPQAQMERYKAAGLNPNLIYGEGSASAGNSSAPAQGYTAPTLRAPQLDTSFVPTAAQQVMQGMVQASAVRKSDSETAMNYQQLQNLEVDNQIKRIMALRQEIGRESDAIRRDFLKDELSATIANMNASAMKSNASAFLTDQQRFLLEAQRPFLVEQAREDLRGTLLENGIKSVDLSHRDEMLIAQIANYYASAELAQSNTELNKLNYDLKDLLKSRGLNISDDEFDRMVYGNSINSEGGSGRAIANIGKVIAALIKAIK